MWKVLYLAVLMVMVIGQSCGQELDPLEELLDADVDGLVHSKETVVGKDGSELSKESVMDRDCQYHASRVKINNNVSTVVNDFEQGMGFILTSDAPDKCFVRNISRRTDCKNGYYVTSTGGSSTSEKRYKEAGVMSPDDVPATVREGCKGRTIVRLVEKTDGNEDVGSIASRKRRACSTFNELTCTKDHICHNCCHGWWWGRHCSNCCSDVDNCHTIKHYTCHSNIV